MKPRTSLAISAGILVITFIGARLYVGQQLAGFDQDPAAQPASAPPKVNVVAPRPQAPPPPPPEAKPDDPTLVATQQVQGAIGAFTTFVELSGEDRTEAATEAVGYLTALTPAQINAVPEGKRADLASEMEMVLEQIPTSADLASARRSFLEHQVTILEAWKLDASRAKQALSAAP